MPVVSIPQGMSLEDFWQYQKHIGILALNAGVVLGVVLWEYIQHLPEERSLYESQRRPEWRSPAPWAFLLLRYSAVASTIAGIFTTSVKIKHCQLAMSFGEAASVCVVASSGILFCCRVVVFWDKQRVPLALICTSLIVMLCCWGAVATQRIATAGFDVPFGTNCHLSHLVEWTPISYAASAPFHAVTFGLAITKIVTIPTMSVANTGLTYINRACILYLLITTISSIVLLAIFSVGWKDDLVRRVAEPYFVLIMMAMGSRVYLNLQLHTSALMRTAESNRFTAQFWPPIVDPEKPASPQTPAIDHVPRFEEPSIISRTSDRRSHDTHTTSLTAPTTLATSGSYPASILAPSSYASSRLTAPLTGIPGGAKKVRAVGGTRSHRSNRSRQPDRLKSTWHGV
ncbi:hypothetical protein B0H34DRAFT_129196 [Crassisporium funariophilum]|nr:hypothetical protein B0H34DRAFT_129196 [Crassisporium funariophilum]